MSVLTLHQLTAVHPYRARPASVHPETLVVTQHGQDVPIVCIGGSGVVGQLVWAWQVMPGRWMFDARNDGSAA